MNRQNPKEYGAPSQECVEHPLDSWQVLVWAAAHTGFLHTAPESPASPDNPDFAAAAAAADMTVPVAAPADAREAADKRVLDCLGHSCGIPVEGAQCIGCNCWLEALK